MAVCRVDPCCLPSYRTNPDVQVELLRLPNLHGSSSLPGKKFALCVVVFWRTSVFPNFLRFGTADAGEKCVNEISSGNMVALHPNPTVSNHANRNSLQ